MVLRGVFSQQRPNTAQAQHGHAPANALASPPYFPAEPLSLQQTASGAPRCGPSLELRKICRTQKGRKKGNPPGRLEILMGNSWKSQGEQLEYVGN